MCSTTTGDAVLDMLEYGDGIGIPTCVWETLTPDVSSEDEHGLELDMNACVVLDHDDSLDDDEEDEDEDEEDEADEPKLWTVNSEAINYVAQRFAWVQTRLLESFIRSNQVYDDWKEPTSLWKCTWSSLDPVRVLVYLASIVNAYYMMTGRDMVEDDSAGRVKRHAMLNMRECSTFDYLRQRYSRSITDDAALLQNALVPVCFLKDANNIGIRVLHRVNRPNMLYDVRSCQRGYSDARRAGRVLRSVLAYDPLLWSMWNQAALMDNRCYDMVALHSEWHVVRPHSVSPVHSEPAAERHRVRRVRTCSI